MGKQDLLVKLLRAAKAGECPDPQCSICKEKWAAIKEVEEFLAKAEGGMNDA